MSNNASQSPRIAASSAYQ